jgi:hypothetical protein
VNILSNLVNIIEPMNIIYFPTMNGSFEPMKILPNLVNIFVQHPFKTFILKGENESENERK